MKAAVFEDERAVDVWPVRLAVHVDPAAAALLSKDEAARAARFSSERDRGTFVSGRAALRIVLGIYLGERPEAIAFAYGERGKPRLGDPANADARSAAGVHFNVSHKAGLALIAIARWCEVGVDVENVAALDDRDAVAKRFFSCEESHAIAVLPAAERDLAFYRCWTRKEAYVKCTGAGLSAPFDRFCVSVAPGDVARVVSVDGSVDAAKAWAMHDIAVSAGYVAALAYRDAERPMRVMTTHTVAELFALADR